MLIIGGTSGIGLAAARQAKAAGASVIVAGFDATGAERVASENGFAGWRAADITKPDTITTALADIPHVHNLVLLAGTFVAGKVLNAEIGRLRRAFEERIWAAIHTLRALGERSLPTRPSRSSPARWPPLRRPWKRSPAALPSNSLHVA